MTAIALDTSVAVPWLVDRHPDHDVVEPWARTRSLVLTDHSLAETYAVLTRLPAGLAVSRTQAAEVIEASFPKPSLALPEATRRALPSVLAAADVVGGATYDALVALAARDHEVTLATRDHRALPTYRALGVRVEIVG